MRILETFVLGSLVCAAPMVASAQQYGAGTGFPLGEKSRVHTGLDMLVGFDSNSRRYDSAENPNPDGQLSDWKGIIRPSLGVNVPGSSVELDLLGQVSIMRYFGTGSEAPDTVFGGNLTTKLRLGSKDSFLGFLIENQFVRTPVFLDEPGTVASDERRFPLWHDRGKAVFTLRPGGRALEFDVGYQLLLNGYDDLPVGTTHSGLFEARWKFLPKTAFLFHADVGYFKPTNQTNITTASGTPINVYLGAIGQVTNRLDAEITLGYGDTLSSEGGNFTTRGPIGNLIATYNFNDSTKLSLGYRRQVMSQVVVNSYSADAPFAKFQLGLLGRLRFSLFGQYQYRKYARSLAAPDQERIAVNVIIGDARVEYWFFAWLNASIVYRLQVQSPQGNTASVDPTGATFFQDFTRHQAFLNVGLRY